jgi:hypothetical protein
MGKAMGALFGVALAIVGTGCATTLTMVNKASGSGQVAHVGDSLELVTASGKHMTVTLTQVVDPAHGAGNATSPHGRRFVAVVLRIADGSQAPVMGDAAANSTLVDTAGRNYVPSSASLAECAKDPSKHFSVSPGQSVTTCEPFEVHTSATVSQFQFYPTAGGASDFGEWRVP